MLNFFFKFSIPHWHRLTLLLILIILTSGLALATPYVLKIIIDDIFPKGSYQELVNILLILLVIYVLRIAATFYSNILQVKVSRLISTDIRIALFKGILTQDITFFRHSKLGENVFLLSNDVDNIQESIISIIVYVLTNVINILGILVMLFLLNKELALLSLIVIPLIVINIRGFTPAIKKSFGIVQKMEENIHNFFYERLRNIRVLKKFDTINHEIENAASLHEKLTKEDVNNSAKKSLSNNITVFLMAIGPLVVLIYGGRDIFNNLMSLGSLIAFIQYLNKLYSPTISLVNHYNELTKAKVSMTRIYSLLNKVNSLDKIVKNHKKPLQIKTFEIQNLNIVFGENVIVREGHLLFEKGKIYGIIGESGSGKTSLINIICGFTNDVDSNILINDIPSKELKNWSRATSLIEKENQLFNGSIMYNITYGVRKNYNESDILLAIENSALLDVTMNLKDGVNTIINDSGSTLSDGQKQRISIARSLLSKPSILIFDEATSSLDIETERRIMLNIKNKYKDMITIFVTHRPSSLELCDEVYKIENQKIHTK